MHLQHYLGKTARFGAAGLFLLFFLVYAMEVAGLSWRILVADHLIHCRETTENIISLTLHEGNNPFALDSEPAMFSAYGPIFYILSAPFSTTLDQARFVNRCLGVASTLAFPFVFCALAGMRRKPELILLMAGFFATFYAYLSNEPGSKPGALATLLSFVCLAYPHARGFAIRPTLLALCAGTLAVFMKSYFVFAPVLLILYIFLFVAKRRALASLAAWAATTLLLALVLEFVWPNSCSTTFFSAGHLYRSLDMLHRNLAAFSRDFAVLLLVAGAVAGRYAFSRLPRLARSIRDALAGPGAALPIRLRDGTQPLFAWTMSYPLFLTLATASGYVLILGQHTGNTSVYLSHMVLPYFLWWLVDAYAGQFAGPFAARPSATGAGRLVLYLAFALQAALLGLALHAFASFYTADIDAPWKRLEAFIDYGQNVMGNRMTAHLLHAKGRNVLQYGQTEYASSTASLRYPDWKTHCEDHFTGGRDAALARRYDLIVLMNEGNRFTNVFVDEVQLVRHGYVALATFPVRSILYQYTMRLFVREEDVARWKQKFDLD